MSRICSATWELRHSNRTQFGWGKVPRHDKIRICPQVFGHSAPYRICPSYYSSWGINKSCPAIDGSGIIQFGVPMNSSTEVMSRIYPATSELGHSKCRVFSAWVGHPAVP